VLSKPLLTTLLLIPMTINATASAETRPNLDEQVLKQRYNAFVESLDKERIAKDYPRAVEKLDSPDPKMQIAGIKTLAATEEIEVIPWIVPILNSEDRHVRIYAGQALNAVVASHELKRRDQDQPDRVVIHPPGPDDVDLRPVSWVIQKMLRMPDDGNTHAFAANMIGYLGLEEYKDDLRQLLTSRHPAVTQAATRALEMLGGNEDVGIGKGVVTPLQEVALDLSRLRGWGTRSFTYQVEREGERMSLGTVTMAVEVHDQEFKLTDTWDLTWHGKKVRLNLEITCRRNNLLRPTTIRSAGEGDDEVGTFTVVVGDSDATVTSDGGQTRKIDFPADTLTDMAMFRIFTLLHTTEGAAFSVGHVMEVSELNLKGPAEIVYRGLEEITLPGDTVKLHKFVYLRDGRIVAEAWVDSDHFLRQLRLDGQKVLTENRQ
jgi:hypothetical protein